MSVRVTALVVDHLAALLGLVLRFDGPADAVMSRYFKQHPKPLSRQISEFRGNRPFQVGSDQIFVSEH